MPPTDPPAPMMTIPPATPEDLALDLAAEYGWAVQGARLQPRQRRPTQNAWASFGLVSRKALPALIRLAAHWKQEAEKYCRLIDEERQAASRVIARNVELGRDVERLRARIAELEAERRD